MKNFIWLLPMLMATVGSSVHGETLILASGQEKILASKIVGQVTVSNPKAVKVILQKGNLLLIGRSPGLAEIFITVPRRHIQVTIYSTKLSDARKAVQAWLHDVYGLRLETTPDKLILHGTFLRLKDWMAVQELKRQYRFFEVVAHPIPRVAGQLRDALDKDLRNRSLFTARAKLEEGQVKIVTESTDKNERQTFNDMAEQFGVGAPENSHSVELRPMVEIEIVIAEMKKDFMKSFGLKTPDSYSSTIIPSGDLRSATNSFNPIDLQFNAAQAGDWGRVLANPKLLCRSGEQAHFVAGGQIPIKLMAWRQSDVIWKPYGVILDISPNADSTGAISTKLVTEISLLDEAHKVDGIPGLLTNRIETHFDLRGSKTIALSGLIKSELGKNDDETPLLGQIPILGELFKSKSYKDNRTELVIFVTPRVVSPDNPPEAPALPAWRDDDD